jgi:hypothetical protein
MDEKEDKIVIDEELPKIKRQLKRFHWIFWVGFAVALLYIPAKMTPGYIGFGVALWSFVQVRMLEAAKEVLEDAKKKGHRAL